MPKVLVVAADILILETLADLFRFHGFEVFCTWSRNEAFREAAENHFDIVLVDFDTPFMKGLEFVRHVQASNNVSLVFMMSGRLDLNANWADGLGITAFLQKPFVDVDFICDQFRRVRHRAR